jgi:hypothetical protein
MKQFIGNDMRADARATTEWRDATVWIDDSG